MQKYNLNYLDKLEAESIHIIREFAAEFKKPVMLYSLGKDSSVILHLAKKAFWPGKIPFPLLHIDTGFKFREMIEFRDWIYKNENIDLIVAKNESPEAKSFSAKDAHTEEYIYHKKTKPLIDALKKYNFDAALGGARRDEEKSRAKERIFSHRNMKNIWDPKNQRPELWNLYNTRLKEGESMRVFPISNWTEFDVWEYIKRENIKIVSLYFAQKRKLLKRNGIFVRVDEFNQPEEGEEIFERMSRYRTLGCSPSTGAIISNAITIDDIIKEVLEAKRSERETRAIDGGAGGSMEDKKKEGYF